MSIIVSAVVVLFVYLLRPDASADSQLPFRLDLRGYLFLFFTFVFLPLLSLRRVRQVRSLFRVGIEVPARLVRQSPCPILLPAKIAYTYDAVEYTQNVHVLSHADDRFLVGRAELTILFHPSHPRLFVVPGFYFPPSA